MTHTLGRAGRWLCCLGFAVSACGDAAAPADSTAADAGDQPTASRDAVDRGSSSVDVAGEPPTAPRRSGVDLIGLDDWRALGEQEDPWAEHRGDEVECSRAEPVIEDGVIEFDTKLCDHFAAVHPLLEDVEAGEVIEVLASHWVLLSPEPATGHMEIRIGEERLLDYEVDIPHMSEIITSEFRAPRDLQAGQEVLVHVRNHGPNSWRLHQIIVKR